jgi:hypothetical protein
MVRDGRHSGIDDETRTRARRFAEDAGMQKPAVVGRPSSQKQRVVSKKELEKSGLSLRDFLNRERGLTRRGMSKSDAEKQLGLGERPSEESVSKAKAQLGIDEPMRAPRRTPEPLTSVRKPGTNTNYENEDTSQEVFKKGGAVSGASKRADGIATKGKTRCKMR